MEIGCLSAEDRERDGGLDLTLYFTFNHYDVSDLSISMVSDSAFDFSVRPGTVSHIEVRKQKKVLAKIKPLDVPFPLPEIEVSYRVNEGSQHNMHIRLPLAFNKFV